MNHRSCAVALAALLLAVTTPLIGTSGPAMAAGAEVTWGTSPTDNEVGTGRPRFSYVADTDATLHDSIDINNRSGRALDLTIYAADAFTTGSGGLDLLTGGKKSRDVGKWISLEKTEVVVPARATVAVPFTLTIPKKATPGDHTGGIVTSLVTRTAGGVGVDRRMGTRVYIRIKGDLKPSLKVSNVTTSYDGTFAPWSAGRATLQYTVTNDGNVRLQSRHVTRAAGLFGLIGGTKESDDLTELLPGNSRTFRAGVAGVWPTVHVNGRITLDPYASSQDNAGEIPSVSPVRGSDGTWAMPWGQLVLLAMVSLLVYGGLQLRKRRKADVQDAIDQAVSDALAAAEPASEGQ